MNDSSKCSTEMSIFERDPSSRLSLTTTIHLVTVWKKNERKKSEQDEQRGVMLKMIREGKATPPQIAFALASLVNGD